MPEEEPTPIEQSRADTGYAYFAIRKGYYVGFSTSINARRKCPKGQGTKSITNTEVPVAEDVPLSIDGQYRMLQYPMFRVKEGDKDIFVHPSITELTKKDWEAMLPPKQVDP